MKRCFVKFLFLFFSLSSIRCSNGNEPFPPPQEFRFYQSVRLDGWKRTYLLNLPPNYYSSPDQFPLVIALHGFGGDAYQFESNYRFTDKADKEQFIVVYPEGVRSSGALGMRSWNAGYCCDYATENQVADVRFINELIDLLIAGYRVDAKKIYVTGMSNGGMMAYRLAAELSDRIAAIAAVSCSMVLAQDIHPSRPVPIMHLHSVNDEIIPYNGGEGIGGYYFPPVDSVLSVWAAADECLVDPLVLVDDGKYRLTEWSGCSGGASIRFYLTQDGGHAWPGGEKPRPQADEPSRAIDANELIWDFFQEHKLP